MHPDDLTSTELAAIAEAGAGSAKVVTELGQVIIDHYETLPTELVELTYSLMIEHARYTIYALKANGDNRRAVALLATLDQIRVMFRDLVDGTRGDQ